MADITKDQLREIEILNSLAKERVIVNPTSKQIAEPPRLIKRQHVKPKPNEPSDSELREALRNWRIERETLDHVDLSNLVDEYMKDEPQAEP